LFGLRTFHICEEQRINGFISMPSRLSGYLTAALQCGALVCSRHNKCSC